jgi:hypothetical protein
MGEYWIPTNVTKKEFVHPHRAPNGGNGLKLGEWHNYDSNTKKRIDALIAAGHWSERDDIRAFSDYGSTLQM